MDYLPIFVDLKGRRALLVGGGETALMTLERVMLSLHPHTPTRKR